MKTKLLKKLRKDAKRFIHLYPCGFEDSYRKQFSHSSTNVEIHIDDDVNGVIKKYETKHHEYATVDGVDFVCCAELDTLSWEWEWQGTCRLDKAKKILKTLRQEYILQECERIRKERLFKNNEKEYENFKKYIESL